MRLRPEVLVQLLAPCAHLLGQFDVDVPLSQVEARVLLRCHDVTEHRADHVVGVPQLPVQEVRCSVRSASVGCDGVHDQLVRVIGNRCPAHEEDPVAVAEHQKFLHGLTVVEEHLTEMVTLVDDDQLPVQDVRFDDVQELEVVDQ